MTAPRFNAIVFDFDGVLVGSVDVKTRAFAKLYEEYGPQVVERVVSYHLAHGGVSRYEKFRHFHSAFLGDTLTREQERELGARFAVLVEDAVVEAPWLPGAFEFVTSHHRGLPLFVASGTPEEELLRIVARRNATQYFAGVGGSPLTKAAIVGRFIAGHGLPADRVLMIGDSITDYDGARATGVRFLGIGAERGMFPQDVPVHADLTALERFIREPE